MNKKTIALPALLMIGGTVLMTGCSSLLMTGRSSFQDREPLEKMLRRLIYDELESEEEKNIKQIIKAKLEREKPLWLENFKNIQK